MSDVNPPEREQYKGLLVQYLKGREGKPAIVIAKGLGIPGREFGWMFALNKLGFHVAYAPYRGSWFSEGEFLSNDKGELSVTEDISDVISFSLNKFRTDRVYVFADCFGCSPSLVAGARFSEVTKLLIYGGMIFTDSHSLNRKYEESCNDDGTKRDKCAQLGEVLAEALKDGGKFHSGYAGFNLGAWYEVMDGHTGLNPYMDLPILARKQILALHALNDNLVYYERTADFVQAVNDYCAGHGLKQQTTLRLVPGKGHRNGFGAREEFLAFRFLLGRLWPFSIHHFIGVKRFLGKHKKGVQRPNGEWFGVPFYDLVCAQLREFQDAGLLHDKPLEEILNQTF